MHAVGARLSMLRGLSGSNMNEDELKAFSYLGKLILVALYTVDARSTMLQSPPGSTMTMQTCSGQL
jgi:hypothetical protein